jgi:hypothetical protein
MLLAFSFLWSFLIFWKGSTISILYFIGDESIKWVTSFSTVGWCGPLPAWLLVISSNAHGVQGMQASSLFRPLLEPIIYVGISTPRHFKGARQATETKKVASKVTTLGRGGCFVGIIIIMSSKEEQASDEEVCASCGKAAVGEVKLKICTACRLVKYCSVECQKNHRPQHKKECRKRAAELRDDRLFTQPDESHLGECPICCLPHSFDVTNGLDRSKSGINSCCCKRICDGCDWANKKREIEQGLEHKCTYCREPLPKSQEEMDQNFIERAKANDPIALFQIGDTCHDEGDYDGAFQYYTKAAGLGHVNAHYNLSIMYQKGEGVEKDEKKQVYHLEEAAIGGHLSARFNLANHEGRKGNTQKAVRHYIITAKLGDDGALEQVKENFRRGFLSKEDFESALRGHQAAVDATKSKQREEAEEFYNDTT